MPTVTLDDNLFESYDLKQIRNCDDETIVCYLSGLINLFGSSNNLADYQTLAENILAVVLPEHCIEFDSDEYTDDTPKYLDKTFVYTAAFCVPTEYYVHSYDDEEDTYTLVCQSTEDSLELTTSELEAQIVSGAYQYKAN